jgi:hypothetical protein
MPSKGSPLDLAPPQISPALIVQPCRRPRTRGVGISPRPTPPGGTKPMPHVPHTSISNHIPTCLAGINPLQRCQATAQKPPSELLSKHQPFTTRSSSSERQDNQDNAVHTGSGAVKGSSANHSWPYQHGSMGVDFSQCKNPANSPKPSETFWGHWRVFYQNFHQPRCQMR